MSLPFLKDSRISLLVSVSGFCWVYRCVCQCRAQDDYTDRPAVQGWEVEKALALHRKAALAESPRKSKIASTKYAAAIVSACRAGIENAEKFMPRTPYEAGEPAKANVRKVMAEVIAIEDSL